MRKMNKKSKTMNTTQHSIACIGEKARLPFDVGRYTIRLAKQTGGKAGKGHNKTSTIQVYYKRYHIVSKSFRYKINDYFSLNRAIRNAMIYAKQQIQKINS